MLTGLATTALAANADMAKLVKLVKCMLGLRDEVRVVC